MPPTLLIKSFTAVCDREEFDKHAVTSKCAKTKSDDSFGSPMSWLKLVIDYQSISLLKRSSIDYMHSSGLINSHKRNNRRYWGRLVPQLSGWGTNNVLVLQLLGRSFQKSRNFTASSHQNAGFSI